MKTILMLLSIWAITGCANFKEIQVDMVQAKLVKLDTVYRYPDLLKQLTWKDQDNLEYVSFVSIYDQSFSVGSSMMVLRRK